MIFHLIWNVAILLLILIAFYTVGYFVKIKLKNLDFFDETILGFLTILTIFHFIAILAIYYKVPFDLFFYIILLLSIGIFFLYISKKSDDSFWGNFQSYILDKGKCSYYVVFLLLCIATFFLSGSTSDSWLYTPMVLSSITTNEVYYVTSPIHNYDTYYLFNSILVNLMLGNDYINLIVMQGFLENILFVLTMYTINKRYFTNYTSILIWLQLFAVFGGVNLFLPHYGFRDVFTHLFKVPVSGTLFLYTITIPFLFEYILSKRESKLYLIILLISGFSFSSSTIYMGFVFVLTLYTYRKYILKDYEEYLKVILLTIVLLAFQSLLVFFDGLLISIMMLILVYILNRKLVLVKCIDYLLLVTLIVYVIYVFGGYFLFSDQFSALYNLFHISFESDVGVFSYLFPNIYVTPIYLTIIIYGFYILLKKNNKEHILLVLLTLILFVNRIAYLRFGEIIGQSIYHRVYMFANLNIIFTIGFLELYEKVKLKYKLIYLNIFMFLLVTSTLINSSLLNGVTPYTFTNSFYESKIGYPEIFQIPFGFFEVGSKVYVTETKYVNNITKYFQFDYNASITSNKNEADYAIINKSNQEFNDFLNFNEIYETSNYKIYKRL